MNTTAKCSKCGECNPVEELNMLPEEEKYQREFSMFLLNKTGEKPVPPTDDALLKKYGFDRTALLCDQCLRTVTE